jgi:arylsulfatase A-like enzyme
MAMRLFSGILVLFLASAAAQNRMAYDALKKERATLPYEWRDARRVPPGEITIRLGAIPDDAVLRIGARPVNAGDSTARIEILRGDDRVDVIEFSAPAGRDAVEAAGSAAEVKRALRSLWQDRRVDLDGFYWFRTPECSLRCSSAGGIWLSPCEIFVPDTGSPKVLLLLFDTLRLDHAGCYGYPENTTPVLDSIAADGVQFWRLMPQSSWTKPSVASLMTGTYPSFHGARLRDGALRPGMPDIARHLAAAGLETLGFYTNINCHPDGGFGAGYIRYQDFYRENMEHQHLYDSAAAEAAAGAVRHAAGRPWFIYTHLMGPHRPYTAPAEYADRFRPDHFTGTRPQRRVQADLIAYDGDIALCDEQAGAIIAALKQSGQYEETLIIALSDHGEQFMEHGQMGHGKSLHEEELRVPLIIKLPGNKWAGEHRKALVEMVDIAPTLLELLNLDSDPHFQGRSFMDILARDRWEYRAAYSSLIGETDRYHCAGNRLAKYLLDQNSGCAWWFDVPNDLDELRGSCQPNPDAAYLDVIAARYHVRGAPGRHLRIVPAPEDTGRLTVVMDSGDDLLFDFDCPPEAGHAVKTSGGIRIEVDLAVLARPPEQLRMKRQPWLPEAHLLTVRSWPVALSPDRKTLPLPVTDTRITVEKDGVPVRRPCLRTGNEKEPEIPGARRFAPDTLLLHGPPYFVPETPPEDLTVYLYDIREMPSMGFDEELAENLRALGYLE